MNEIKRFNYYIRMIIGDSEDIDGGDNSFWRLVITDDSSKAEDGYPYGIPIDLAYFIHMHCKCYFCGAPINRNLSKCCCGIVDDGIVDPANEYMQARFEYDFYDEFNDILNREDRRVRSSQRNHVLSTRGEHSKEEIDELFRKQDGLCFYCGTPLSKKDGPSKLHKDHFVAIVNGGINDISNIVLSCRTCNLDKRDLDGNSFISSRKRNLDKETRGKVNAIQKKVDALVRE